MRRLTKLLIIYRSLVAVAIALAMMFFTYAIYPKTTLVNAVGIGGFVASIAQLLLLAFDYVPALKVRRVLFLGKRNSPFNRAVIIGLREIFSHEAEYRYDECLVDESIAADGTLFSKALDDAYQQSTYDAVIIRLCDTSSQIQNVIIRIIADGVFVVLIDVNIERDSLPHNLPSVPFYIGSDFEEGGRLIAKYIAQKAESLIEAGLNPLSVNLLGPTEVRPALDRGRSLMWELECLIPRRNATGIILKHFDPEPALNMLITQSADIVNQFDRHNFDQLLLFCGNDNICAICGDKIIELSVAFGVSKDNIYLMGYDGIKDETRDSYYLKGRTRVFATIDTLPTEQGRIAAQVVLDNFAGKLPRHKPERLIKPTFVLLQE